MKVFRIRALLVRGLPAALTLVGLCVSSPPSWAAPRGLAATGPSEDAMRAFLKFGKWTPKADDNANFTGEALDADFIKSLVQA